MKLEHFWQPMPGSRELVRFGAWFLAALALGVAAYFRWSPL